MATGESAAAAASPNRASIKFSNLDQAFEASSLQFGVSRAVSTTGPVAGRPNYSTVTFTKMIDRHTAPLQRAAAIATMSAEVSIGLYSNSNIVGRIVLEDVLVVSDELSYGGDDPLQIVEVVSVYFNSIRFRFAGTEYSYDRGTGVAG
jgi:type VI protein secretion system component Hcp